MRYYLIAGEASGDSHGADLMAAIKRIDPKADFRFFGGELMAAQGGVKVMDYRKMAFMGFWRVLFNLMTVLRLLALAKSDIRSYCPDRVILIDYPGFNLKIAQFVKIELGIAVHYYIAPKAWAWKQKRVVQIRRYVDYLYSILPFEIPFFINHGCRITYVGNPSLEQVASRAYQQETLEEFRAAHGLSNRPIVALVAGSRRQEIRANLPIMIAAASRFADYQMVLSGAPGLTPGDYAPYIKSGAITIIYGETYRLIQHAYMALVTSGTATLETALIGTPQVVCYRSGGSRLIYSCRSLFLKVPYVSLVNLIAGRQVVPELLLPKMNPDNLTHHIQLLGDRAYREVMIQEYKAVKQQLGALGAAERTAALIVSNQ